MLDGEGPAPRIKLLNQNLLKTWGVLHKSSGTLFTKWKKYWCVLAGASLYYYKEETTEISVAGIKPVGSISLDGCTVVPVLQSKGGKAQFTIIPPRGSKRRTKVNFQCANMMEMLLWLASFNITIEHCCKSSAPPRRTAKRRVHGAANCPVAGASVVNAVAIPVVGQEAEVVVKDPLQHNADGEDTKDGDEEDAATDETEEVDTAEEAEEGGEAGSSSSSSSSSSGVDAAGAGVAKDSPSTPSKTQGAVGASGEAGASGGDGGDGEGGVLGEAAESARSRESEVKDETGGEMKVASAAAAVAEATSSSAFLPIGASGSAPVVGTSTTGQTKAERDAAFFKAQKEAKEKQAANAEAVEVERKANMSEGSLSG